MSRLLKNLAKGGFKTHNRFGFGAVKGEITLEYPMPSFIKVIMEKERKALFYSGRAALRHFKRVLGKKPPTKTTKTGKSSSRYRREVTNQAVRAPWTRTGILKQGTDFSVNEDRGFVVAGPFKIDGMSPRQRSSKPVPQLLQEGGTAIRMTKTKTGRSRRLKVSYRAFPYKDKPMATAIRIMTRQLKAA